jgi:hypothetical protein
MTLTMLSRARRFVVSSESGLLSKYTKTGEYPDLMRSQAATGESIPPDTKQTTFPFDDPSGAAAVAFIDLKLRINEVENKFI